jgi:phosphoribosylformylglycinamidine synthase
LKDGQTLVLIGASTGELGSSIYLRDLLGREEGAPPPVDLAQERRNGDLVRSLILDGLTTVVHDLSDGGLLIAAAEMAMASNMGVFLTLPGDLPDHAQLLGEDQARYLVALSAGDLDALDSRAAASGVPYGVIGQAGGCELAVNGLGGLLFALDLDDLRAAHEAWMPAYMDTPA